MLFSTKAMVVAIVVASVTTMASNAAKAVEATPVPMTIELLPEPCRMKGVDGVHQGVLLGYGKPIQGCWQQTEGIVTFNFYYSKRLFTFTLSYELPTKANEEATYRLHSFTSR